MKMSDLLSPVYSLLFRSKGLKRSIASLCAVLIAISPTVPAIEPFLPLIIKIGGLFGGVGLVAAGASSAGFLPKK